MEVSVHRDLCSFMKPVVFIDLPRNPLSVNGVNDGGENGNGVSDDGGHFLTAKGDNRLALMGYSCSPVGFGCVALTLRVDQNY